MTPDSAESSRPGTLAEVAARSATLAEFGRNLQDWLHTLRGLSTRAQVAATVVEKPALLAARFTDGDVADAYLGAYAELVAARLGIAAPAWAFAPERVRSTPWFAESNALSAVRGALLLRSPLPFKRRNLFAAQIDLPLRIRAGRPELAAEHKRRVNAERQRRFRARRAAELKRLRRAAGS